LGIYIREFICEGKRDSGNLYVKFRVISDYRKHGGDFLGSSFGQGAAAPELEEDNSID